MCLGVPVFVKKIEANRCSGEVNGVVVEFCGDYIKDLKVGDRVMVHAGFAIERITDETYKEIVDIITEMSQKYENLEEK